MSKTSPKYSIKVLRNPKQVSEAGSVVATAFAQSGTEALSISPYLNEKRQLEFWRVFFKLRVGEKLSLIAVDEDDKVVGACLNEDFGYVLRGESGPETLVALGEKDVHQRCVSEFLEITEAFYAKHCQKKKISKVIHVVAIAVLPEARGNGVMGMFLRKTEEMGRLRGYETLVAECTNVFSKNAYLKYLNAVELLRVLYDDFQFSETKEYPFRGVNAKCVAHLKKLGKYKKEHCECAKWCFLLEADIREKE